MKLGRLDVYKRQITQLIKNGEISFNQPYFNWMESGISLKKISIPSGANLSNLTTVSYTHLDVYKRQELECVS